MNHRLCFKTIFLFSAFLFWGLRFSHALEYHSFEKLTESLQTLQNQYSSFVRLTPLAASSEGREVWLLRIGLESETDTSTQPAMLVVAGVEGNHLAGTEMALFSLQKLCADSETKDDVKTLIRSTTIYMIPRLNPDAAERFFHFPKTEQIETLQPEDEDHDGFIDEDGLNDLNNDGLITWIRVEDAKGKHIEHPDDPRILIEADPIKGERGKWLYFAEGNDEDEDEQINEDGPGGIDFNRNFPINTRNSLPTRVYTR